MNLTSLHFKRNNSGVFHSFKFTPGKDKLRNLYIFSGKDLHPQWLLEAIKFLFNTEKHPSAAIHSEIDIKQLKSLKKGGSYTTKAGLTLSMHGAVKIMRWNSGL